MHPWLDVDEAALRGGGDRPRPVTFVGPIIPAPEKLVYEEATDDLKDFKADFRNSIERYRMEIAQMEELLKLMETPDVRRALSLLVKTRKAL